MYKLFESWRTFNNNKKVLNEIRIEGGTSVKEMLETLENYGNKTWIVFDTETLGFNPVSDQITEIAAVAINPNNWDEEPTELDVYHRKVHLLPSSKDTINYYRKKVGKTPAIRSEEEKDDKLTPDELLKMTGYYEDADSEMLDSRVLHEQEQKALEGFYTFIKKFGPPENVVLCAQNATFDLKMINTRYMGEKPKYPVFDTVFLYRLFLIPVLQVLTLSGDEEAEKKLETLRVINKRQKTEYRKAEGKFSSSLGKIRDIYGVTGSWHAAIADVKMLISVTHKVIQDLKNNPNLNIVLQQASVAATQHSYKNKTTSRQNKEKLKKTLKDEALSLIASMKEKGKDISFEKAWSIVNQKYAETKRQKEYERKLKKAEQEGKPEPTLPSSSRKRKLMGKIKKDKFRKDLTSQR